MHKNTQEYFKSLLQYDQVTGVFNWKARPPINRSNNMFNALFAGSRAGSVSRSKRSKTSYIVIKIEGKTYKAHRIAFIIMTGSAPEQVDHIDHNGMNNAWENLRASDSKDNSRNLPKQVSNKSGYIGVNWHKSAKKWQARAVDKNGFRVDLGRYSDINDAIHVRAEYEKKFGYFEHRGEIK